MDLTALSRVFERHPTETPAKSPERPQDGPATAAPYHPTGSLPDWQEASEERAAILEHEAGASLETATATAADWHPSPNETRDGWHGYTVANLQAAAGADWPEIASDPAALDALAFLLLVRTQRLRGDCPTHYTAPALCEHCGPVWIWEGGPARMIACPWSEVTARKIDIPRPAFPSGRCRIKARASERGEALWPGVERVCREWRPIKTGPEPIP
jgi:hypothetical protein